MSSSNEYQRKWRAKNPGYAASASRKFREKNPGVVRKNNLRANYGLTIEQYEQLCAQQNGCCAVCKSASKSALCVDHHHESGVVRALLCGNCNTAFGHLKEDPARISALLDYAQKFDWLNTSRTKDA